MLDKITILQIPIYFFKLPLNSSETSSLDVSILMPIIPVELVDGTITSQDSNSDLDKSWPSSISIINVNNIEEN